MHEKLLADYELSAVLETDNLYILTPNQKVSSADKKMYAARPLQVGGRDFSSAFAPKLSRRELFTLVQEADRYQK